MLPSEFEGFVRYAAWLSLLVALIALWRVRRRGPAGLFLVASALSFAALLFLVLAHSDDTWLYGAGTVVVAGLVADLIVRQKPKDS